MSAPTPLPRVLQVVQRFLPEIGGTETHIANVAPRIAAMGEVDLTVLATDRSGALARTERFDGYDVIRRRSYPEKADLYLSPSMALTVARGGWDLVHFQGVHTLVPPLGMAAARAAGVPYVLTFHSGGHSAASRTAIRSAQFAAMAPLLRGARRLVAVSRFERGRFAAAANIPLDRFVVVGNGGALPPVADDVLPVPGRVLSSGRLERYKGHHRAIEALPHLRTLVPGAHVVVLGSGPMHDELLAIAARLGVAEHVDVHAVPPGDRAAMATEIASASVMAALSDYEAHPVGVMEAVTAGLPVVGLDVAGTGDLVEDGWVTGLPVGSTPSATAEALAIALRAAAPADGGAAGPHVPAPFELPTWESSAAALAQVYREVLADPGPRALARRRRQERRASAPGTLR